MIAESGLKSDTEVRISDATYLGISGPHYGWTPRGIITMHPMQEGPHPKIIRFSGN